MTPDPRRRKIFAIVAALSLLFLGVLTALAIYTQITSKKDIPTSIAAPTTKPAREVKDVLTNDDGNLIITYTDGTQQNAGRVVGSAGLNGEAPSQAQISAALVEYCADGHCDAKAPTQQQLLAAVSAYCADGVCRGDKGADAAPITAEQILAAITVYCTDGRCKGADGQSAAGPQGEPGKSPVMRCVTRAANNTSTKFVAWKYESEPDSAYRDLYKLPVWAECTDPVDLTGGAS